MSARVITRFRRRKPRGFTLTELMIVVALVGIFATLGVASFRKQLSASKSTEAAAVIQAIRAAQEAYRAENQRYLDVSGNNGVSDNNNVWYPAPDGTIDSKVYAWGQPEHPDYARWQRLGASVNQPVQFRYLVHAGAGGATPPTLSFPLPNWRPTEPWYIIHARADADDDGTFCNAVATSASNEVVFRNEGE